MAASRFIKHGCTDIVCCTFFTIALCGFIAVSVVASMHGDLRRLYHGLDWESNVCGVDAVTSDYTFVYWCRNPNNLAASPQRQLKSGHNTFSVGERVEGQDAMGKWWPLVITDKYPNGSFAGRVDDGFGTKWPVVYPSAIRQPTGVSASPQSRYKVGDDVMGKDSSGQFWPVTITKVYPNGSYAGDVHDGFGTEWPLIYSSNLRRNHLFEQATKAQVPGRDASKDAAGSAENPHAGTSPPPSAPSDSKHSSGSAPTRSPQEAEHLPPQPATPAPLGVDIAGHVHGNNPTLLADGFQFGPTPPPYAGEFAMSSAMACTKGFQMITSAERCAKAAKLFGLYFESIGPWCSIPSGCSKWSQPGDHRVYFSTCPRGMRSSNYTVICEKAPRPRCVKSELENPTEDKRQYSSVWSNDTRGTGHAQSMLDSPQGWSSGDYGSTAVGEWLSIDLGDTKPIIAVVVQGRRHFTRQWVTKLKVSASADGQDWEAVPKPLKATDEEGARKDSKIVVKLPYVLDGRYVKITVVDYVGFAPALRAGVEICKEFYHSPTPKPAFKKAPMFKESAQMCDEPYNRSRVPCGSLSSQQEARSVDLRHPVCVKACPDSADTNLVCAGAGGQYWHEAAYETRPVLGHYCMPKDHDIFMQMMASLCDYAFHNFFHKAGLAFLETWPLLLVTTSSAMLVGFIYMFMLRSFAAPVVTCIVNSLCVAYGCLALFLLVSGLFFGGADGMKGTCDKMNDFVVGLVSLLFCIAYMVCARKCKTLMQKSASTLNVSFEAFFQCPALIIEPMISTIIRICWLIGWTAGFLLIVSMGTVKKEEVYRSFSITLKEKLMMAYYVFMFIWISEFLTSLKCYVMSFIVQRWFYQIQQNGGNQHVKPGLPCSVLCEAYQTSCYHFGSLAMGSLIIPLVRPIRLLWRFSIFVTSLCASGKSGGTTQHCLAQYWNSVGFINKEGYSDVALFSVNYMPGTVHANRQVRQRKAEVGALMGACFVVELIGVGLMILIGGVLMFFEMRGLMPFFDQRLQFFAEDPAIPAILAAILAAFFGAPMMLAFGEVADDLLYCYSMELEVRRLYPDDGQDDGSLRGLLDCSGMQRKPMAVDPLQDETTDTPIWLRQWIHQTAYDYDDREPAE